MSWAETLGLRALRSLDPERAHGAALTALKLGLAKKNNAPASDILRCEIAGLQLSNPLGLAAGFDKNAEALAPLAKAGFGFLEVGAATPRPQAGNAKPRLFRLAEDRAVINRFGFNNEGSETIAERLKRRPKDVVIGLNLGANKNSADRATDYSKVLVHCAPTLDFASVNVSSPNTERLRDLQGKVALNSLLKGVLATRSCLPRPIPVFLKIAPDLSTSELEGVAEVAMAVGIDGIIATNTTLSRDGLQNPQRTEKGGLSGAPLFERSTRVLAQISALTDGTIPLIGVGGISSAEDAYAKIRAGATAIQLYSALVYSGLSLVQEITSGLEKLLVRDGYSSVAAAVGTGRTDWL